ncbi:MAG: tetratricopeptide repeat protein [Methanocellales archaeon]|nr:tetratricopeptide repeat protein [Methanocellales archaeon]
MSDNKTKDNRIERINTLLKEKKLDEALELTEVSDIKDLLIIGEWLGKHEVHDEAEKMFDRITQLDPNHADAWSKKGISLGILERFEDAMECFEKAIEINPNHADAWFNKGLSLQNLEKQDEATECFEKAIEIDPKYAKSRKMI